MTAITREKYIQQQRIEEAYNRSRVYQMVQDELIADKDIAPMIKNAETLLTDWVFGDYFKGKAGRLNQVAALDLGELTLKVITEVIAYCNKPQTLVSISSRCAHALHMADKIEAIQTMAEVISVIADCDLFDIDKLSNAPDASYMVMSKYRLEDETMMFVSQTSFLPPMIHRPKRLKHNRSSGHITVTGDSLILGGFNNHHDFDICLDVLNTMNANEFELDVEFLSTVEEPAPKKKEVDESVTYITRQQREAERFALENFEVYKRQCYFFYMYYAGMRGNTLHFTHKVDKRGRVYSCGYHMSPQGNSFKKAMLNFKKKSEVTGVADFLQGCN